MPCRNNADAPFSFGVNHHEVLTSVAREGLEACLPLHESAKRDVVAEQELCGIVEGDRVLFFVGLRFLVVSFELVVLQALRLPYDYKITQFGIILTSI